MGSDIVRLISPACSHNNSVSSQLEMCCILTSLFNESLPANGHREAINNYIWALLHDVTCRWTGIHFDHVIRLICNIVCCWEQYAYKITEVTVGVP